LPPAARGRHCNPPTQ